MRVFSKTFRGLIAIAALSLTAVAAHAQSFPTRPVRILVPCAAGGAVDVLARTLGQSLSKTWGQLPVIENRPGAALKDPVVLTALEKMGATPAGSSPADFDAFMRAEAKKCEPVLKEADIKMQ